MWQTILKLIDGGDFCALPIVILALIYIGSAMTGGDHRRVAFGKRMAAGVFVLYFGYAWATSHPETGEDFIFITIRAILAGGLVLGPTWIAVSIFSFMVRFLGRLKTRLFSAFEIRRNRRSARREQRRKELEEQQRLLDEKRLAPQRDREWQLAEKRRQEAIQDAAKVQELRLRCEAHYRRHFAAVKDALPEDRFKELLDTYLPKDSDPAVAEARLQIVIDMIDAVSGGGSAATEFCNLQDLISHFEKRRGELASLGLAADELDTLENYIESARDRAVERFLSK